MQGQGVVVKASEVSASLMVEHTMMIDGVVWELLRLTWPGGRIRWRVTATRRDGVTEQLGPDYRSHGTALSVYDGATG